MTRLDLPKTVRVVFLDFEEFDSQGSKNYAKSPEFLSALPSQKVAAVINLTMLAHDTRTGDKEQKMNNMKLYTRAKTDQEYALEEIFANKFIENGKRNYEMVNFKVAEKSIGTITFPVTAESFRLRGVPSITLTQDRENDLNPRYMTSNDFVETLNINTYTNVFKFTTSAVLSWNYDIVK